MLIELIIIKGDYYEKRWHNALKKNSVTQCTIFAIGATMTKPYSNNTLQELFDLREAMIIQINDYSDSITIENALTTVDKIVDLQSRLNHLNDVIFLRLMVTLDD